MHPSSSAASSVSSAWRRHKRSKRGCLTCRNRRKKCDETYKDWGDGRQACTACHRRGEVCRMPDTSHDAFPSHSPPPANTNIVQAAESLLNFQGHPRDNSGRATVEVDQLSRPMMQPGEGSLETSQQRLVLHDGGAPPQRNTFQEVGAPQQRSPFQDGSWLDRFFEEIVSMTEPADGSGLASARPQNQLMTGMNNYSAASFTDTTASNTLLQPSPSQSAFPSAPISMTASLANSSSVPSTALEDYHPSSTRANLPSQSVPRPDWSLQRTIELQDLDDLLSRCGVIYERYIGALVDTSLPVADGEADARPVLASLMEVTKSSSVSKASMVACCLAYRDVIAREKKDQASHFVRYLTSTSKSSAQARARHAAQSDEQYASLYAGAWYEYALKELRRIGSDGSISLAARMLALLNLRYASVCLLGAKAAFDLAPDIERLLKELHVDISFLQRTAKSGTIVAFLVQALAAANVMDAASVRGMRSQITNDPPTEPTLLTQDDGVNLRFRYLSSFSVDLVLCLKHIQDLAADIEEGKVLGRAEVDARSKALQAQILSSCLDITKKPHDGIGRLRAQSLHEMWRQAALIYLYQDVHDLGPLSVKMQSALHQIFEIAETVASLEQASSSFSHYIDVWDMTMVWFLAGTVCVTPEQKSTALRHLQSIGCEQAIVDTIEVLKMIWQHMDETGKTSTWKSLIAQRRKTISYTF